MFVKTLNLVSHMVRLLCALSGVININSDSLKILITGMYQVILFWKSVASLAY